MKEVVLLSEGCFWGLAAAGARVLAFLWGVIVLPHSHIGARLDPAVASAWKSVYEIKLVSVPACILVGVFLPRSGIVREGGPSGPAQTVLGG